MIYQLKMVIFNSKLLVYQRLSRGHAISLPGFLDVGNSESNGSTPSPISGQTHALFLLGVENSMACSTVTGSSNRVLTRLLGAVSTLGKKPSGCVRTQKVYQKGVENSSLVGMGSGDVGPIVKLGQPFSLQQLLYHLLGE